MNSVRQFMRRFSVRITLYFLASFLAVLALILIMTGALFRDRLTEEISLAVHQKMTLAATKLDNALGDIRTLQFALVRSDVLQNAMRAGSSGRTLEDMVALKQEISRLVGRYASVRSAILITRRGEILDPIYEAEPYRSRILDDPEYQEFTRTHALGRFSKPNTFPLIIPNADYAQRNTITYFADFFDTESYESLGCVAINVTKPSLTGELTDIFEGSFAAGFVLDERGNVIVRVGAMPDADLLGLLDSGERVVNLDGTPYARYAMRLTDYPNWSLLGLVSYEAIMTPVRSITLLLLVFSLVAVLALLYVGGWISHRITAPLRELGNAMAELGKGRWERIEVRPSTVETEDLLRGYNRMVDSLQELTRQIREEQQQKQRISMDMMQSRLELLQSQINPHFIHNTLNTMRYMAQKQGNNELNELIVSFNSLLRASMSQSSDANTLEEELACLRHYINIQLRRYDVELTLAIDVAPDALEVELPKLLLQPLVENALFHGILPVGRGSIRVIGRRAEGRLWITVADDGAGMPPDRLAQLLSGTLPNARGYNQIGLKNVNDRLNLFYGQSSHLVIVSAEQKGTSIGFSIPIRPLIDNPTEKSESA